MPNDPKLNTVREEPVPKFDSDLSRSHPTNREAAHVRRLRWSKRRQAYVDEDGCMIRDRFGQRF